MNQIRLRILTAKMHETDNMYIYYIKQMKSGVFQFPYSPILGQMSMTKVTTGHQLLNR